MEKVNIDKHTNIKERNLKKKGKKRKSYQRNKGKNFY